MKEDEIVACIERPKGTGNYQDPTPDMLNDPLWNAIWEEIKGWDINVPDEYIGYMGATGNHVTAIYRAIHQIGEENEA
jgi:hypothetical protein